MNDDPRLIDSSDDELVRALLRAGREELPSEEALQRTVAAVGTALGIAAASSSASAAASAGSLAKPSSGALLVLLKWVGAGVTAGALAGAVTSESPEPSETIVPSKLNVAVVPAPQVTAPRLSASEPPLREAPVADPPSANAPPRPAILPAPVGAPTAEAAVDSPSWLAAEIALLDRARGAQRQGASAEVLALTDQHVREFSGGRLAPEAAYLRMEALRTLGRLEDARDQARRILAAYPSSPQAARARELAGDFR